MIRLILLILIVLIPVTTFLLLILLPYDWFFLRLTDLEFPLSTTQQSSSHWV